MIVITIVIILLIIIYYYHTSSEGMEDPADIIAVNNLSDMDPTTMSYEEFKSRFPRGDAVIYNDLTILSLNKKYDRKNIQKIYDNWK